MKRLLGFSIVLLCVSAPASLFAQANAAVGGTVSDATGALIPGVEVTASNVNTGIVSTLITNETGNYQFASLQPGSYKVSAALSGFRTQTYENVQLSQSQQVRLNFKLEVASQAQAVEVTIAADTVLATTTASVGDVLPDTSVRSLPLQTRNVLDLVATTPGAVGNNFGGTRVSAVNTTRDGIIVSDGRYMDWNGAYAATFTSPDLVEEVQITVNTVDAEAGRGAGQVRLQTRSGTNQFHGAGFYTNNNSALNSMSWFENLAGAKKSYQNRNQFGGRLGGPIVKNKTFFFFLYDGQRFLAKRDFVATVFTDPARQGIFRYLTANAPGAAGISRRNGNAFSTTPSVDLAGNVLTSSDGQPLFLNSFNLFSDVKDPFRTKIDQVWVGSQLLPRMPSPNDYTVGDGLNTAGYRWLVPLNGLEDPTGVTPSNNRDQYNIRIDHQINSKHKLFGTISREKDWGLTSQAGIAQYPNGFNGLVERRPQIYTVALTSTLSATMLNEFRFGRRLSQFSGYGPIHLGCCQGSSDTDINEQAKKAVATLPTINGYLLNMYLPGTAATIADTGITPGTGFGGNGHYLQYGTGGTRAADSPLLQFSDNVSWTHGAHSLKAGAEFLFAWTNGWNTGNTDMYPTATLGVGNVAIQGITAANFGGLNAFDIPTAQDLLGTLAGSVASVRQSFIINSPTATAFDDYKKTIRRLRRLHQNDWSGFFKDNWKVNSNLTLNLGLRYDKYGVPYEASGIAGRPKGGQAGLFGISGTNFSALRNPYASGGTLSTIELVGKNSPNPGLQVWQDDWNNFAPSIGFSWSLPYFRNTVVRGGYGINYTAAPTFLQYDANIGGINGAEQTVTVTPAAYTDLSTLRLPLQPTGVPFAVIPLTDRTQTFTGYDDHRVSPYVQNFNLSVQHELARNLTLDVAYSATKGTKLWQAIQLNEVNIFNNGILDAFNITRAGGNAPLFDRMLNGLNVPGVGTVNGSSLTGSEALRRFATTNIWIANGEVGALANFINNTNAFGGARGQLLRNAGLPENFIVVNPQFGSVTLHGNNDNSTYQSLVTQVTKRMSHGVTGQFAYTWAKTLGNSVASDMSQNTDTTSVVRDPRNRSLQKGPVSFDRRHQFNAFGTWDLPFGPNRGILATAPVWVSRIVEGWQVSGIFNWDSGTPLGFWAGAVTGMNAAFRQTLGYGPVALPLTQDPNTADLIGTLPNGFGKVQVQNGFVQYFPGLQTQRAPLPNFGGDANLAGRFSNQVVVDRNSNIVVQNPQPGTTGNSSYRWFNGPRHMRFDAALSKRIQIAESKAFTIRADAINLLNRPIWGDPNTDINSASFGRITGYARGYFPRTITIGTRFDF